MSLHCASSQISSEFGLSPSIGTMSNFVQEGGVLARAQLAMDLHEGKGKLLLGCDESSICHQRILVSHLISAKDENGQHISNLLGVQLLPTKHGVCEAEKVLDTLKELKEINA